MAVIHFAPAVAARAQRLEAVAQSCAAVRASLAEATTVAEAYAIYEHCNHLSRLLQQLTIEAGARCNQLGEDT